MGGVRHNVLHIDAHYDTFPLPESGPLGPKPHEMTLPEYRSVVVAGTKSPLYRWDTYIPLYRKIYPSLVDRWVFATHSEGTAPEFPTEEVTGTELPGMIDALEEGPLPWVVNIDLDYFRNKDGLRYPASERATLFRKIAAFRQSKHCLAMTVCLSPECCGGMGNWQASEELCHELMDAMGVDFQLEPGDYIEEDQEDDDFEI